MQSVEVDTWSDDDEHDDDEFDTAPWRRSSQYVGTRRYYGSTVLVVTIVAMLVVVVVVSHAIGVEKDSAKKNTSPSSDTRTMPTNQPSSSVMTPSSGTTTFAPREDTFACLDLYQCQSEHRDRFGHSTPLLVGHALCNDHLRFGLTPSGVFQWHDCDTLETKVVYDPSVDGKDDANPTVSYFSMSSRGAFQLFDSLDAVVWNKEPNVTISFTKECLHNPLLDCPYLYVHGKHREITRFRHPVRVSCWTDRFSHCRSPFLSFSFPL